MGCKLSIIEKNLCGLDKIYNGLWQYSVYISSSHLNKLDVIQAQALRVCSGAFKTLPFSVIQVEMGEMPLEVRMRHLIANYWTNLQGHNDLHPTKEVINDCWGNGRNKKDYFGQIGNKIAKELGAIDMKVSSTVVMAPWNVLR